MNNKIVTYELSIKVQVEMPDNFDPDDVFVDLEYDFYAPNHCEMIDTDIHDKVITSILPSPGWVDEEE